jgi:hypothetical protein
MADQPVGLFLDFLAGNQTYHCTPWGNPTRTVFGWQRPCYLLGEGYAKTFKELMEETEWEKYGPAITRSAPIAWSIAATRRARWWTLFASPGRRPGCDEGRQDLRADGA